MTCVVRPIPARRTECWDRLSNCTVPLYSTSTKPLWYAIEVLFKDEALEVLVEKEGILCGARLEISKVLGISKGAVIRLRRRGS